MLRLHKFFHCFTSCWHYLPMSEVKKKTHDISRQFYIENRIKNIHRCCICKKTSDVPLIFVRDIIK